MSVTLNLYRMSKKNNSSGTPAGLSVNPIATVTGEFREPWDILEPVITVEDVQAGGSSVFTRSYPVNYAQIYTGASDRNRLYWISRIVWISDKLLELHLTEDAIGTWSAEIRSSTQYVLRSSSASNGDIVDEWYPITSQVSQQVDNISTSIPWHTASPSLSSGYYVVGIINDETGAYGAVSYYLFPAASFDDLRAKMMSTASWTGMQYTDIEESLYKSLFNPMQYIASVKWFPWFPSLPTTFWNYVQIGWWPVNLASGNRVYPLQQFTYHNSFTLNANSHPQFSRGNYLNTPPWRKRTLFIEPFGAVEINTAITKLSVDTPEVEYWVDFVTGKAKLRVLNYLGTVAAEAEAMLGVDINIAQSTQDIVGAATSAAGAAGSLLSAGFAAATGQPAMAISGAEGVISGIGNAASAFVPTVTSRGSNGSVLAFATDMLDITYYTYIADADLPEFGAPLCEVRVLSGLSGFCMCSHPHVTWGGCTAAERVRIEAVMASGIILEA